MGDLFAIKDAQEAHNTLEHCIKELGNYLSQNYENSTLCDITFVSNLALDIVFLLALDDEDIVKDDEEFGKEELNLELLLDEMQILYEGDRHNQHRLFVLSMALRNSFHSQELRYKEMKYYADSL